jgi:A/G-specific adenine glycosylase
MLQQTTVAAVTPFYERWMARLSSVDALASSSEEEVLAAWQGLGYYRRARNLHTAAKVVVREGWPESFASWLELPGVGRYTAGAIASIVLGERVPAVDGNVRRVHARLTGREDRADPWASHMAQCGRPGDVNQALMDLGATVCTPRMPNCGKCPFKRTCAARREGRQTLLPGAPKRAGSVEVQHNYVVVVSRGKFGVRRFVEGEWWTGMYGFPHRNGETELEELGEVRHTVTKHRVVASVALSRTRPKGTRLQWKTREELESLPMPSPHRKMLSMALARLNELG